MRVVFDTNILVLNFIGSPASNIIDTALSDSKKGRLYFFYSEDTMQEYQEVLIDLTEERPEFFDRDEIKAFLDDIREHGSLVHPTETLDACSHEPDNRFLECAAAAEADYIITVNNDHFPATYQPPDSKIIKTVTPGQFQHILFSD